MNPFLYLFYYSVRALVLFCFRIFYRKTIFLNRKNLKITKPTIVVSNHPSTMTDPLNVAGRVEKVVFFLANASMFKHWFTNWFFNTFYCIPIERPKDVGGRKISNADSFAKCDAFLSGGGCLYIAPEGVSNMGRRLQELKTGTARIALSAENKNDFSLGLEILPVGLDYSALTNFRSDVLVNVGEVMQVGDYKAAYAENPVTTVRELTADLEKKMQELIVHTEDATEEQVLKTLESLMQAAEPLSFKNQFLRSKKAIAQVQTIRRTAKERFQQLEKETRALANVLKEKGTSAAALYDSAKDTLKKKNRRHFLFLAIAFPVFLFGWINHFLANFIPGFMARKIKLYVGYQSTIKLFSGLIFYPLIYGAQIYFVHHFFESGWITLIYLLTFYPIGIFAWRYHLRFYDWQKGKRMEAWQKKETKQVEEWQKKQELILEEFTS